MVINTHKSLNFNVYLRTKKNLKHAVLDLIFFFIYPMVFISGYSIFSWAGNSSMICVVTSFPTSLNATIFFKSSAAN